MVRRPELTSAPSSSPAVPLYGSTALQREPADQEPTMTSIRAAVGFGEVVEVASVAAAVVSEVQDEETNPDRPAGDSQPDDERTSLLTARSGERQKKLVGSEKRRQPAEELIVRRSHGTNAPIHGSSMSRC